MKQSILLLGALAAGAAVMGAGAANAAGVHDLVSFSASDFTVGVGSDPAPTDPVTGSFTISFDPTQTYTDETAGITLNSLNIALGSALSFSYSTTGSFAGVLVVGGIQDTAAAVQYSPSTDDFWLFINDFATTPAFRQLGYTQTAVSSANLFYTPDPGGTGSVTVTPITGGVPEPSTWAMMLAGFAGLGFLGYRQTVKARLPA
jgi:PEP-CTERM motif